MSASGGGVVAVPALSGGAAEAVFGREVVCGVVAGELLMAVESDGDLGQVLDDDSAGAVVEVGQDGVTRGAGDSGGFRGFRGFRGHLRPGRWGGESRSSTMAPPPEVPPEVPYPKGAAS